MEQQWTWRHPFEEPVPTVRDEARFTAQDVLAMNAQCLAAHDLRTKMQVPTYIQDIIQRLNRIEDMLCQLSKK